MLPSIPSASLGPYSWLPHALGWWRQDNSNAMIEEERPVLVVDAFVHHWAVTHFLDVSRVPLRDAPRGLAKQVGAHNVIIECIESAHSSLVRDEIDEGTSAIHARAEIHSQVQEIVCSEKA